jgi:hypothetical protein
LPRDALALDYPVRPVRLIVGFPAGGLTDVLTRLLSPWLSGRLGQQFVVEDQPGVSTNLATEMVVRTRPDGYTLLMATSTNAINATLYDNLRFNFIRDTTPVAGIARTPLIMETNPSFPAKTVPDFITNESQSRQDQYGHSRHCKLGSSSGCPKFCTNTELIGSATSTKTIGRPRLSIMAVAGVGRLTTRSGRIATNLRLEDRRAGRIPP